jgi:hypothetical protein
MPSPFADLDGCLKNAELGVEMLNVGPFPGNLDPVGFIRRLGDEVVSKLTEIA